MLKILKNYTHISQNFSKKCRSAIFFISYFISTGFFIGKIKYAPGTFGSLFAIIFCQYFILLSQILQITVLSFLFLFGFFSVYFFLLLRQNKQDNDPKEVVIDEIVAVFFVSWLCKISRPFLLMDWRHFLFIFALFRLFDILKPFPISWVDKNIHGAKGIMIDDLLAAIVCWFIFILSF